MFDVHQDIRRAETLASEFYTDERWFRESKEKIFARSWQLLGPESRIDNIRPEILLEGFLDEPVVLTRADGRLNCLSNVCTHRGKIVAESPCAANGLRCGYHGRRFDLEGRFLSMPEFEETLNFPSEKDDLPRVPSESWNGLVFVSPDPAGRLEEFVGDVAERTKTLDLASLRLTAEKDYLVNAHWALYCENYLEGFHVPYVHPALNREIDYGTYTTELFRYASLQTAWADASSGPGSAFADGVAALYFFIFPNLMLNFYPWGLSVNIVKPIRRDLTKVSYMTFVSDESKLGIGAGGDLETVELEDQAAVESVQLGIRSRYYDKGRYSPTREQGTHHFHRLICEFLG